MRRLFLWILVLAVLGMAWGLQEVGRGMGQLTGEPLPVFQWQQEGETPRFFLLGETLSCPPGWAGAAREGIHQLRDLWVKFISHSREFLDRTEGWMGQLREAQGR